MDTKCVVYTCDDKGAWHKYKVQDHLSTKEIRSTKFEQLNGFTYGFYKKYINSSNYLV